MFSKWLQALRKEDCCSSVDDLFSLVSSTQLWKRAETGERGEEGGDMVLALT